MQSLKEIQEMVKLVRQNIADTETREFADPEYRIQILNEYRNPLYTLLWVLNGD